MSVGNPGDGRGDDETRDSVSSSTAGVPVTETGWQAVADELADALQEAMLRNPSLTARAWDRAHAALGRYEGAGRGNFGDLAEPPESHEA
jgi:hypothetical protein